jgi:hypothetical protein
VPGPGAPTNKSIDSWFQGDQIRQETSNTCTFGQIKLRKVAIQVQWTNILNHGLLQRQLEGLEVNSEKSELFNTLFSLNHTTQDTINHK